MQNIKAVMNRSTPQKSCLYVGIHFPFMKVKVEADLGCQSNAFACWPIYNKSGCVPDVMFALHWNKLQRKQQKDHATVINYI